MGTVSDSKSISHKINTHKIITRIHTPLEDIILKVLVSDPISDEGISILKQVAEVDVITNLSPAELVEKISEYDALVVRSETQVTKEVLEAGHLKIVGRAGVGVDNIDIDAATRCGTIVVNAPFGNMNSAAEHTIAMMMAMTRNIPQAYASMKKGEWNRKQFMACDSTHLFSWMHMPVGYCGSLP